MSRQDIAEQAARYLERGFVVVDLETTGFPSQPEVEIIEIAIVNHKGEILLNSLVKPQGKIPSDASAINGIFDLDVLEAPTFEQMYPQMATILNKQIVAAYNYTFEEGIFGRVCQRHKVEPILPHEWYCPMRAYQAFGSFRKFIKLTDACNIEGITVANAHRALGDCLMTLDLIRKMADAALPTQSTMF